jgi:hypothetical protein
MSEKKDEIKCPLTKEYCYGCSCAFWAYTKKFDQEKNKVVNDKGYCLVRDFMITLMAGASF